jgi:hypothetical protein
MRVSVPCLIGAVALIAPAAALAHVDDPKETSVVPRFEGPGWTEAEGGVAGSGFASSSVILRSWISLVDFGHAFGSDRSKGLFIWTPTFDTGSPADVNGDGFVGVDDLVAVISNWGPCPPPCPPDITGDGTVDVNDIVALFEAWE